VAHQRHAFEGRVGVSDGLNCFPAVVESGATHEAHRVGSGRQSVEHAEFRRVNILLGNPKTSISGTYHAFDFRKYARRYLAEVQYRFIRRFRFAGLYPASCGPPCWPIRATNQFCTSGWCGFVEHER
jgi:hypothetical protein